MKNKLDYLYFLNKVKFLFGSLIIISLFLAILLGLNTFLIKIVYDDILSTFNESLLIKISIIFFIIILLISFLKIIKQIFLENIKHKLLENFRISLLEEFINYQYKYFIKKNTGEITKRIVEDCELVSEGFIKICNGISNLLIVIIWLIIFALIARWIFIIYFFIAVFLILWFLVWQNPISKTSYKIGLKYSKLYKLLIEIIPGIKVIKYELLQKYILNQLNKITKQMNSLFIKNTIFHNLLWSINAPLAWTANILILFFGIKELNKGNFTIGLLTVFLMLIWQLLEPLFEISSMMVCIEEQKSAYKRINEYRTGTPENELGMIFNGIKKNIKFSNITFKYPESNFYLKNINLNIKKGQSIAIIGKTGNGKTTIANLLLRLYHQESGKIFLDDIDISSFSIKSIRENIILVPQDIYLYTATLRKNIDIKNQLSDDEILFLLDKLCLTKLLKKLPDGLNTIITENGTNLSGGEKKRIGIIRALAFKSNTYIFDEITANLDPNTVKYVIDYVYNLGPDITTITITHDLNILSKMDKIYLIKNNTIKEYKINNKGLLNNEVLNIYSK